MEREFFRLDEISWRGLGLDLLRNLWMILLAAAAVWLAATGLYNLTYRPQYTSSATLVVTVQGSTDNYTSLTVTAQMADVFGQVFQSDALREKIREEAGENIEGTISCTPIAETNLLVLDVSSPDPRQAYLYINAALEHYAEVAGDVFSDAILQVVQEPEVPASPSNSSPFLRWRYLMIAGGALFMAAVICLFYIFRFTVKTYAAAERQLDGRIRGVIPFEDKPRSKRGKRSKKALLISSPVVTMDFAEAGRRTASGIEHHMRRHQQKVLLVTSAVENEGKSTAAANLALTLAERRRKVLLIDGDLRKPAQYKVFEMRRKGRYSLDQVLRREIGWKEAVGYYRAGRIWQLLQFAPVFDPAGVLRESAVKELVDVLETEFDYVIIDCPPAAVSTDAEIWMGAADAVVLVVREDWADVRIINETVDVIWQSGKEFIGFYLNAFHGRLFREFSGYGYGVYEKGQAAAGKRG